MTYRGRRVNMEVDTIRPSAHARVTHNYGLISAVFHRMAAVPCDRQYAKRVRVREREITRRIYMRVWPELYTVYNLRTINALTEEGGGGGGERAKTLTSEFRKWAAPRAISVIKCWMRTCRRGAAGIAHSRALIHDTLWRRYRWRCSQYWFDKAEILNDRWNASTLRHARSAAPGKFWTCHETD